MNEKRLRARRPEFRVEALEGRVVLSGAHASVAVSPAALIQGTSYLFLNGTVKGTYTTSMHAPDTGAMLTLQAKGTVTPLGQVTAKGTLHGPGFIKSGPISGTVTLTNKKGSVTLSLVGPVVPGFTPPSSGTYQFTFQKGTGTYANDIADGTVSVKLTKDNSISLTFHGAPNRF
jgi:hypothetical protein